MLRVSNPQNIFGSAGKVQDREVQDWEVQDREVQEWEVQACWATPS